MTEAEEIGARLAQLRRKRAYDEERDIESKEIAAAVGVSDVAYSRYESGARTPKPDVMQRLADYFGVTRSFLRYGEEAPRAKEMSGFEAQTSKPAAKPGKSA